MTDLYYDPKNLQDFPKITEYATEQGKKFFQYYGECIKKGKLTEREKALIALSISAVRHCPYCIDAYTNKCMSLKVSPDEMMEAIHVGAAVCASDILAHATHMRKILKKNKSSKK